MAKQVEGYRGGLQREAGAGDRLLLARAVVPAGGAKGGEQPADDGATVSPYGV